ncbi:MAG: hypothetical protein JSV44_08230, partial [Candidatus Zixiibacteriota bacterium]
MIKKASILTLILLVPTLQATVLLKSFDEPYEDVGISDNAVTDIISHKGAIWLTTGAGLSFTIDGGLTWNIYNSTNGLVSDGISAIYSEGDQVGDRLWLATGHGEEVNGDVVSFADGLTFTADAGFTFENITPQGSYGFQKTVFDLNGADSVIFAASLAGGLFGSFDKGENWRTYYYSLQDSIEVPPRLTNRYFAAVVDTYHTDSVVVWAGTAGGLMRYIWAPAYAKPSSNNIFDLLTVSDTVLVCGDRGLTRLTHEDTREVFYSAFESSGLPGNTISSAHYLGGRLFVGTLESLGGSGTGLAVSEDLGLTFEKVISPILDLEEPEKYPREFVELGNYLYMAAAEGGLYRTADIGQSWEKVTLDTLEASTASGRNIANSLAADTIFNRLLVGTDSGLVTLYPDGLGEFDSLTYYVFPDNDSSGARSYRVRAQVITDTILGLVENVRYWSVNHPIDPATGNYSVYVSLDSGLSWVTQVEVGSNLFFAVTPPDTPYYDIDFLNSFVVLVGRNIYNQWLDEFAWGYQSGR